MGSVGLVLAAPRGCGFRLLGLRVTRFGRFRGLVGLT